MLLLSLVLAWLNVALLAILLAANLVRLVWYRASFMKDLQDFERGPGYFTLVAGVAIVGSEALATLYSPACAPAACIVWLILGACFNYTIFFELSINEYKPRFEQGINGGWLISVVATQTVANLCAELSGQFPDPDAALFLALAMWLAGGMLYIWLIALIFYRFTFFPFRPESFLPPFWINYGGNGGLALTGTTLLQRARGPRFCEICRHWILPPSRGAFRPDCYSPSASSSSPEMSSSPPSPSPFKMSRASPTACAGSSRVCSGA